MRTPVCSHTLAESGGRHCSRRVLTDRPVSLFYVRISAAVYHCNNWHRFAHAFSSSNDGLFLQVNGIWLVTEAGLHKVNNLYMQYAKCNVIRWFLIEVITKFSCNATQRERERNRLFSYIILTVWVTALPDVGINSSWPSFAMSRWFERVTEVSLALRGSSGHKYLVCVCNG